jgi:hypothetical protein
MDTNRFGNFTERIKEKNKGTTEQFESLMKRMEDDDCGKYDFLVPMSAIAFNDVSGNVVIAANSMHDREGASIPQVSGCSLMEYTMTPNAWEQIFNKIGIPSSYARKTPASLMKPHFDFWRSQWQGKELFIRAKVMKDGNHMIRAFLTSDYAPLDNKDIFSAFRQNIKKEDYIVTGFEINDDMFNARLILPNTVYNFNAGPDGKTNPFYVGLHIVNGETGNYSVNMDLLIWEQWCSNGAVRRWDNESLLSRRHIGSRVDLPGKFAESLSGVSEKGEQTMELFVGARQESVKDPVSTITLL